MGQVFCRKYSSGGQDNRPQHSNGNHGVTEVFIAKLHASRQLCRRAGKVPTGVLLEPLANRYEALWRRRENDDYWSSIAPTNYQRIGIGITS